jgi:hypothetical protein
MARKLSISVALSGLSIIWRIQLKVKKIFIWRHRSWRKWRRSQLVSARRRGGICENVSPRAWLVAIEAEKYQ